MKKLFARAAAVCCAGVLALSLAGCNGGKSELLGAPARAESLSYTDLRAEPFQAYLQSVDAFACTFAEACLKEDCNFAVSPVSAYAALALCAQCAGGNTKTELLSALGCDDSTLRGNFSKLYRVLNAEYKTELNQLTGMLQLSDSVWVNESTAVKQACIDALSNEFFAYSYRADFLGGNADANRAVRAFVKDKTKGRIDRDFALAPDTVFTLINALYLKDVWNVYGDDLSMTSDAYAFAQGDGTTAQTHLLNAYYECGRAYKTERYSAFYANTLHNYRIKFLVPNDGFSACDVFTARNLAEVNALSDYDAVDEEQKIRYYTRCLFPEFKAAYDGDLAPVLRTAFGLGDLFDPEKSDFSALTDERVFCANVRHVTDLTVNKKGIEGAAVTVIPGAGAPGPDEYTEVYEDFVVDRAFAFLLTDSHDVTLFAGIVNTI